MSAELVCFNPDCPERFPVHFPAAYRTGRSAARHRPPTVAEAPRFDAKRLPDLDWNALGHGSCSVFWDGGLLGVVRAQANYSGTISPVPPRSGSKSLYFGSPSRIARTLSG